METQFEKVFQQAVRPATSCGTEPCKPWACGRQQHRANAEATTVEAWYRANVAIHFVDHILEDISAQFSDLSRKAIKLLGLVPSIICEREVLALDDTVEMYSADLPSPELFSMELQRWKHKFKDMGAEERPSSCAKAIKACDKESFPNVFILLQIACTLPVTSCECERSASALRWLRNFMQASMTESRLSSLALMHIHQLPIDLDDVVSKFSEKHSRRMQLYSVLLDLYIAPGSLYYIYNHVYNFGICCDNSTTTHRSTLRQLHHNYLLHCLAFTFEYSIVVFTHFK